jgi:hypothetical protein
MILFLPESTILLASGVVREFVVRFTFVSQAPLTLYLVERRVSKDRVSKDK